MVSMMQGDGVTMPEESRLLRLKDINLKENWEDRSGG